MNNPDWSVRAARRHPRLAALADSAAARTFRGAAAPRD
ncbi:hypothetical protein C7S17_1824 [Burkholderia thailandensis]|nr:hypothetical protein [Burkholderia thailandensis]